MPTRVATVAPDISPYRADRDDTKPDTDDPGCRRGRPRANPWEVIGALGGAAGVLLAVFLAWYGGYQVRKERRIIHDLDVLRDIADRAYDVGRGGHGMPWLRNPLLMLPDREACPVLRAFAGADPTPDGQSKLRELLRERYPDKDPVSVDPITAWLAIEAVCLEEIEAAIRARLHD